MAETLWSILDVMLYCRWSNLLHSSQNMAFVSYCGVFSSFIFKKKEQFLPFPSTLPSTHFFRCLLRLYPTGMVLYVSGRVCTKLTKRIQKAILEHLA